MISNLKKKKQKMISNFANLFISSYNLQYSSLKKRKKIKFYRITFIFTPNFPFKQIVLNSDKCRNFYLKLQKYCDFLHLISSQSKYCIVKKSILICV